MKTAVFLGLGIVIVAAIALGLLLRAPQSPEDKNQPQACTQEAKICPDGTAVGRTGPNCEFAQCPSVPTSTPTQGGVPPPLWTDPEFDTGIGDASEVSADGKACVAQGGSWDPQFKECVGIGETQCKAIDGEYNACASACRHSPDMTVCTLQCVEVCQL